MGRFGWQVVSVALTLPIAIANAGNTTDSQDLNSRLLQLEAETQSLRDEVAYLRDNPVRLPEVDASGTELASALVIPPLRLRRYRVAHLR